MMAHAKPRCPYCDAEDDCRHFIGWTEDGCTVQLRTEPVGSPHHNQPLLPTDIVINTGVSARVYRDWVFA